MSTPAPAPAKMPKLRLHHSGSGSSSGTLYFGHFWANLNMLCIKKNVFALRNSLVLLGEALGLKKGPKAPKKRLKASKRGQRPPKALRRS